MRDIPDHPAIAWAELTGYGWQPRKGLRCSLCDTHFDTGDLYFDIRDQICCPDCTYRRFWRYADDDSLKCEVCGKPVPDGFYRLSSEILCQSCAEGIYGRRFYGEE